MIRTSWGLDFDTFRGIYRDPENGLLFGVCAGIADRFGFNVLALRVLAVICLLAFTWVTVLAYVAAVIFVREKPLVYSGREAEHEFWRRHRDHWRHS